MCRRSGASPRCETMVELAIIADDLTGALDAAALFAMRGISTAVALQPDALQRAIAAGTRVIGASTDSREASEDEARKAVERVVSALPAGTRLFKKIDSRLKGNIPAELDAFPYGRSLAIPAIPEFGRWTRDGKLGGFGVDAPIDIASRLGSHASRATIPNIATQADIDAALATAFDLPIGARGLAEALARAMAPAPHAPDTSLPLANAYCVIGSTDPITMAQLDRLRTGVPGASAQPAAAINPVDSRARGRVIVVRATPVPADSRRVAQSLGATLARLAPPAGSLLILSGGATAQAVLRQLGIDALDVVGEALPGLPLSRGGGLTVITKSGGFGNEETLRRLLAPFHSFEERIAYP